jgi:hypothetical protein
MSFTIPDATPDRVHLKFLEATYFTFTAESMETEQWQYRDLFLDFITTTPYGQIQRSADSAVALGFYNARHPCILEPLLAKRYYHAFWRAAVQKQSLKIPPIANRP